MNIFLWELRPCYHAPSTGNSLPTFRDILGADRLSRNIGKELPLHAA